MIEHILPEGDLKVGGWHCAAHPNAQVERVLAGVLGHVLVGRNASRLEGLGRELLLLPTAAETEV